MDYLVRWHPESVADLFLRVETLAHQVAVIYRNGHAWSIVAPERRALFWKGIVHVKAELIDIATEIAVALRLVCTIVANRQVRRASAFDGAVLLREVPEAHVGLLYVDGRLVRELPPGLHGFWRFGRNVGVALVEPVDPRVKALGIDVRDIGVDELVRIRLWARGAPSAKRGRPTRPIFAGSPGNLAAPPRHPARLDGARPFA